MDPTNNQTTPVSTQTPTPNPSPTPNTIPTPNTTPNLAALDNNITPTIPNPITASTTTKKKNSKTIFIILIIAILLAALIFLGVLAFKSLGDSTPSTESSRPTLELAKSVCAKYGGKLEATDNSSDFYKSEFYYCANEENAGIVLSNGASLTIGFIRDNEKKEAWSEIRSTINDSKGHEDVSGFIILENSDNFIKAYSTIAGLARVYIVAYDNVIAEITAERDSTTEEILIELGFPTGKRANDYR